MSDGPPTLRMTEAEQEKAAIKVPLDRRTLLAVYDRILDECNRMIGPNLPSEASDPDWTGLSSAVNIVAQMLRDNQAHCP